MESNLAELEKLLTANGVQIAPTSVLADLRRFVPRLIAATEGESDLEDQADYSEQIRGALGWHDIAVKVLAVAQHPEFNKLAAYFPLFARSRTANPAQTSGTLRLVWHENKAQRREQSVAADVANKTWELYVACLALQAGDDLDVERPSGRHRVPNPDVMFRFRGRRWGIACKVPAAGASAATYRDMVADGVRQVEASAAEHGLILCNLKNVIDHRALLPAGPDYLVFDKETDAMARISSSRAEFESRIAAETPDIGQAFVGTRTEPLVVNCCFSACITRKDAKPRMTPMAHVHPFPFSAISSRTREVVDELVQRMPGARVVRSQ